MNFILHLLSAAISSFILTAIIVTTQCRYTFNEIRKAFVARVQERNASAGTSKKKTKGGAAARQYQPDEGTFTIAFFHPHCSSGGGGERVLWKTVEALGQLKEEALNNNHGDKLRHKSVRNLMSEEVRNNCKNLAVIIYTIDEPSESYDRDLMKHIQERFSISISPKLEIHYVHLHNEKHHLQKSKRLTLVTESWGTIRLAWCALNKLTPCVFVDTTGCAFTFIVAKILAGCKVGAYVHYPTISTDMLSLVWERRPSYNNNVQISTNPLTTYAKLIYYAAFAILYGLVGSLSDLTMVNSSWTKNHIAYLWRLAGDIHVVFPPVGTASLCNLSLNKRENMVLSIGQFRPEKDHVLQLQAFKLLLDKNDGQLKDDAKLILIGSCRGEEDRERVDNLQKLARELGIQESVEFVLNQPYPVLKDYLSRASVGLHTMWNEHFGIGIVEMMAAGLVTVAHNSGGPKFDIIERPYLDTCEFNEVDKIPTGFLASTAEEYSNAMYAILTSDEKEITSIRQSGRNAADRFSDQVFMKSLKDIIMTSCLLR